MSFTLTTTEQRAPLTGTILLSPSKRRKIEEGSPPSEPTTAELWKWTFTHESVAPCTVQDALAMTQFPGKQADFFWLGRVPCRTVKLVGIIVGIQVYEKRIRYTVDDGSAVIDCLHRPSFPPRTPTKKSQAKPVKPILPPVLKPIARIGSTVRVIGKVVKKYETRDITIDSIVQCASPNDELKHWRDVRSLHKSSYDLSTPFIIPTPSASMSTQMTSPVKHILTPSKPKEPPTPSTYPSPGTSSIASSPTKSIASSPAKSISSQSPRKLRHPSRLSSRDLTANTFQIYMKHFMHSAYHTSHTHQSDSESDADDHSRILLTPTKRLQHIASDETPRPGPSSGLMNRTPRPRILALSFAEHASHNISRQVDPEPTMRGFTLSYLRRVPELAEMARRVVKAEEKKRRREERQKAKEAAVGSTTRSGTASKPQLQPPEKLGLRVKRLFKWAIVRELREGGIVLWDGPNYSLQHAPPENSRLWKANVTSNSTGGADSTFFSTLSGTSRTGVVDDDEEIELSDPEPDEEAYVVLTPSYLAGPVEAAIGAINKKAVEMRRRRQGVDGATKETILAFLQKDDRWRSIGEWSVAESLEFLQSERRAWCVGKDRWECY